MRCRKIIDGNIVWFGSVGKNEDGTGQLVYTEKDRNSKFNFSEEQQAVSDSLTQRLSILKRELWYRINYGLSLFEKNSKALIDSEISSIIMSHPDVSRISSFSSYMIDKKYTLNVQIVSIYGEITLNI